MKQSKTKDLQTIFDQYRYDQSIQKKSKTWFQQQATLLARKRINEKQLFSQNRAVSKVMPGKLYMFYYDPKHKDTLPYYDTFPLVFPFRAMPDGFLGLNMHYLPYFHRVQLMTRLLDFANNKTLDENTRLRYSWSLLNGAARFQTASACVKHYLKDHVASTFLEIPGDDWHTAMMLPVERFVGANKVTVWGDSIKI